MYIRCVEQKMGTSNHDPSPSPLPLSPIPPRGDGLEAAPIIGRAFLADVGSLEPLKCSLKLFATNYP
jgi:hypothetical protein